MAFPSSPFTQLLGSNGPVHALTYSSSPSSYILTGSADRSVRLYNPLRPPATSSADDARPSLTPPKPAQLIQTYAAHGYEVLDISVAADNATFASVGGDRAVFLWDVATAKTIRRLGNTQWGHTARINTVSFAGDGDSCIVSGSFDTSVRIWDVRSNASKPIMVLDDARDSVSCVLAGSPASSATSLYEIVTGSVDGRVRFYDIRAGSLDTDVIGASVTSLSRTRDGKGVLVGALDSSIRLMDRDGGGLLKSYKSGDSGGSDASTKSGLWAFKNDEFRLRSSFGGNERWVLCGNESVEGDDGQVVVWDTLTGNVVQRVTVPGASQGMPSRRKVGRDGKEKGKQKVVSCVSWRDASRGMPQQWCCAGTDGVVTVFASSDAGP